MQIHHIPVLLDFLFEEIITTPDNLIIDATLGEGGHSEAFLKAGHRVIGLDRDEVILKKARQRLAKYSRFQSFCLNFKDAKEIFAKHGPEANLILFDLGISMFHYRESKRGFSYTEDEPLDMRLSKDLPISAADIVNSYEEEEIAKILYHYGDEKRSRAIAKSVVRERLVKPLTGTRELALLIAKHYPKGNRIHPATKSFQALRIVVNEELRAVEDGIKTAIDALESGGVVAVMSYHSGEDRIVKKLMQSYIGKRSNTNKYRDDGEGDPYVTLYKKPVTARADEIEHNPASRSAKLRAIRRS